MVPVMASYAKRGKRGSIDVLPSGALRVRVDAGVDPIRKREPYLTETVYEEHSAAASGESW
ncbi:hypothetical protein [Amycolatopsis alkalitolerans]|uniref:Uncharacterized protein n=1 Tax=Amycolatopsis alkalitolerans TaxID=2547244 RepID=A0A5C4LR64_9PSEU|nr:hypothetical protein [Amycolatopsis alkalitolerans]TNC21153.1 hypothetical protein FG385_28835 [Amycolatopsis alkalitolerans]